MHGADDEDEAPCTLCSSLRALLHCAQHAARLCLPCDVRAHAAAPWHERAPLCDGCHAAPAAAHCGVHRASLCAPCALAAGCERHARRPACAYTGFPEPAELARILSYDIPPPPPEPADTWVPDLVNMELLQLQEPSSSNWHHGNDINTELIPGSLTETGGGKCQIAGGSLTGNGDDHLFLLHQDNLGDDATAGLVGLDLIAAHNDSNSLLNPVNNSSMAHPTELGAFEAPSPWMGRRYHHPLIKSCSSEPIIADAVTESMAGDNIAACCHHELITSSSVAAASNVGSSSSLELLPPPHGPTLYASGMPPSSPTTGVVYLQDHQDAALQAPPSSSVPPEHASGQDMDAKAKHDKEKRQEAKQRYKDKKKKRRFDKQIMYVSRKVRADTRNRVKGRFAKASSSGGGGHGDDQSCSAQCGGDDEPTEDDS